MDLEWRILCGVCAAGLAVWGLWLFLAGPKVTYKVSESTYTISCDSVLHSRKATLEQGEVRSLEGEVLTASGQSDFHTDIDGPNEYLEYLSIRGECRDGRTAAAGGMALLLPTAAVLAVVASRGRTKKSNASPPADDA